MTVYVKPVAGGADLMVYRLGDTAGIRIVGFVRFDDPWQRWNVFNADGRCVATGFMARDAAISVIAGQTEQIVDMPGKLGD